MAKAKRVLLLVHPQFRPDRGRPRYGTERDVWLALRGLGYQVEVFGARDDLHAFDQKLAKFRPHIVFNLLEEFRGEAVFDFHLVSFLEALGIPFTGCNPRGMILSRNKYLISQFAAREGVATPASWLLSRGHWKLPQTQFPLFVKLNREHASLGIRESNRVTGPRQLKSVCARLRRDFASEILVQEFIAGEDVSAGIWGNRRAEVLSPRKLQITGRARVSTARLKFSAAFQRRHSVRTVAYNGPAKALVQKHTRDLFNRLDLSGYARFDFRVGEDQVPYLIDVNANPNLTKDEDFSASLRAHGWTYREIIENIVKLGLNYRPNI